MSKELYDFIYDYVYELHDRFDDPFLSDMAFILKRILGMTDQEPPEYLQEFMLKLPDKINDPKAVQFILDKESEDQPEWLINANITIDIYDIL